jgi:antitoxin YefM
MKMTTYSDVRANLAKSMDMVCENHEPLFITRQKAEPVVLMSLADYNSMEETAYLMRSPKNAARINSAIEQLKVGKGITVKI